jgi:hypothetical protein
VKWAPFAVRSAQLLASLVPVAGFFVALTFTVGPVMAGASDAVGWLADRIGGVQ